MKYIAFIILIIYLSSCDSGELWRDKNYVVAWIDDGKPFLSKGEPGEAFIEKVSKEIIAIGSNEKHIVAKQRNTITNVLNYYVIDIEKDKSISASQYHAVNGPLTLQQFIKLKSEVGLPDFEKEFK